MEVVQPHMAIADSRYLWTEVERLKSQVQELRASSRIAQEERARTAELLAAFVTRAQLDAALSTKVSLAHVDAQMDTMRSEVARNLEQKADLSLVALLQSTKLDVSVFDANAWDLHKLRVAMEQHVRDLFATFAGLVEQQVSSKLAIEDFNRVFNPEATGQKASLEAAALRVAKMTDQLESVSSYMNGDRQRQRQVAELNVSMLDLTRKQAATRNSIVQLESAEQTASAQLRGLDEQTTQAMANLQSLTETLSGLQAQTQTDKGAQDARQARLAHNVKQLEEHHQHLSQTLNELEQFAHAGLVDSIDTKLKINNDKLRSQLNEATTMHRQHAQQVSQRVTKTNDLLLHHKDHLAQLDACMRKMAGLLKDTQGELNNVKGPLATLATNLHEENVAILQEIERSQNGTRNIILDYQGLLQREKSSQVFVPLPSRPSSSSSTDSSGSTSRKQKQQMLLGTKSARPHTSNRRQSRGEPKQRGRLHKFSRT
ncbi:hypothetical protein PRIC2_013351 [Phytophthora ramorum]